MKHRAPSSCALSVSVIAGCAALMGPSVVQADSARIQWNSNGHLYQRFDQAVTWREARKSCEDKSGHLATLTSAEENGFVYNSLGENRPSSDFSIGGSDAAQEGTLQWVTDEPWDYQNFKVSNGDDFDYVVFSFNTGGGWYYNQATEIAGYLCEWSTDLYVGTAVVGDLNGNGSDDIAALYVDHVTLKHTVVIRDPLLKDSAPPLSILNFKTGATAPPGLVVLRDLNGNGVPEIGVPYSELGQPVVLIKDAKNSGGAIDTIRFPGLKKYLPKEITVSPDSNGNRASEITVLGIPSAKALEAGKKPKAETRDSETGALLGDTTF